MAEQFLGAADHFAVGISKEFLGPLFQPILDSLKKIDHSRDTGFSVYGGHV